MNAGFAESPDFSALKLGGSLVKIPSVGKALDSETSDGDRLMLDKGNLGGGFNDSDATLIV